MFLPAGDRATILYVVVLRNTICAAMPQSLAAVALLDRQAIWHIACTSTNKRKWEKRLYVVQDSEVRFDSLL